MTGGGTGGHITPILAVAHELKKINPDCVNIYVGERNGKFASLVDDNPDIDNVEQIYAGKFRRYHGESWLVRLFDIRTLLFNTRDFLFVVIGIFQCIGMIRRTKPDIVFLKGGFVGVPVGLACAFWGKPFMTHDSDALPGLANRIVGRWAKLHGTAMPANYYTYPKDKIRHVGVLVGAQYKEVDHRQKLAFRKELHIPLEAKVVMITGGSGGAAVINQEIALQAKHQLESDEDLYIIHQVGIGKSGIYGNFTHPHLQIHELLKNMHMYSGAADVIVTRAGANTVAEFGVQAKACIVVPNPLLTGGHQIINGQYLKEEDAAIIFDEARLSGNDENGIWPVIINLLNDTSRAKTIANNLHRITIKDAASQLAKLLIDLAE